MQNKTACNRQAIKRMPLYFRLFTRMLNYGREYVSSAIIAQETSLSQILIKKDLLMIGAPGKTKLGYNIKGTIKAIETFVGWNCNKDVLLVGYGKLGAALFNYEGFKRHGFNIVAAFDSDINKIKNENIANLFPIENLSAYLQKVKLSLAIIAVPGAAAQGVADTLVAGGIEAIWNFSPVDIKTPPHITVQNEDLSVGLALLCSKLKN